MGTEVLSQNLSTDPTQWHAGNLRMQALMSIPPMHNPTTPFLTGPRAVSMSQSPLFAIGTLDSQGRPWTSLWGAEKGFLSPVNQSMLGVSNIVDRANDPVFQACSGDKSNNAVFGGGQPISALSIDLETRRRVKVSGKISGATLQGELNEDIARSQVVIEIDSSMGNCPKYLNCKTIRPCLPTPSLAGESLPLPPEALHLLSHADLFFMTASASPIASVGFHLSTNHRGGPPGFVRVACNTVDCVQLAYPEYSGNRYYQTLGNLCLSALAGIVIPDFETGDALYATCTAQILTGTDAARLIPRSNLAAVLTLKEAKFVRNSLAFRAEAGEFSPYNPPVRMLASEAKSATNTDGSGSGMLATATLVEREMLTDDVARLRFKTDKLVKWERGQYVILNFEEDLGVGYEHMNNDDPQSLNDDLVRSFTITSPAPEPEGKGVAGFEITVRNVGKVTRYLVKSGHVRAGMTAGVVAFEGNFQINPDPDEATTVGFVAGGVGITPLLGQIQNINVERLKATWSVSAKDLSMVSKIVQRWESRPEMTLYVSGTLSDEDGNIVDEITQEGVKIENRRMEQDDFKHLDKINRWYACTGPQLKKSLDVWLKDREIVSEEFF